MSYILEALKKSELQREIGQVPGIDSEHEKPQRQASGKWLWAGIGVLLLNAGLLALLLWPEAEQQDEPLAVSRVAQPLSAQEPVAPVPAPEPVRQKPPLRPAPAPAVAAPRVAPPAQVASVPIVVEQPVIEQPQPVRQVFTAAPPAPADRINDLPLWPQIPGHLFRQLTGGLRLDVHVYSELPQDRFVLINLQKYHEGEQLQEGPVLDEITSEGVILSFQGQQFRVSAQ